MLHILSLAFLFTLPTVKGTGHFTNTSGVVQCHTDLECGVHGSCALPDAGSPTSVCVCESPYLNIIEGSISHPCAYHGVSRLNAVVYSLFGGLFGVDWFVMAKDNPSYIMCGITKLCTFGGLGTWWLYDFLRLLTGGFTDGNGMPLFADL